MTKIQNNSQDPKYSYKNSFCDNRSSVSNPLPSNQDGGVFPLLLDTLAQLGTDPKKLTPEKGKNSLRKRAVAKYVTNEIIFPLIDLDSPLKKSYWSTFHCANILLQDGEKITGKYCNNRWCIVCNRIRTAKMINGYLPVIKKEIPEPYFITLTVPNVSDVKLRSTIKGMIETTNKINNLFRHKRDFRLKGIRKVECTFNQDTDEFHPHLHFIENTEKAGQELINAWLDHYPTADLAAQNLKPADQNSLIEIFKYTTKFWTKKEVTRSENTTNFKINPYALDVIFKAMYRIRALQSIGIKKLVLSEDIDEIQVQKIEGLKKDIDAWVWEHELSDWVNSSGEFLTGCNANKKYTIQKA